MPSRLGAAAVALTDLMWRLYERRYGDEAVRRVQAITAERDRALAANERLARNLSRVELSERSLAAENDRLRMRVGELVARINDRAARDLRVPVPENPYMDDNLKRRRDVVLDHLDETLPAGAGTVRELIDEVKRLRGERDEARRDRAVMAREINGLRATLAEKEDPE